MELSPFRVTLCPPPLWERIQSPPDCFRHPLIVDSCPVAPELVVVLWLPGVVCWLLGFAGCC